MVAAGVAVLEVAKKAQSRAASMTTATTVVVVMRSWQKGCWRSSLHKLAH
jgi:hypothetical protein